MKRDDGTGRNHDDFSDILPKMGGIFGSAEGLSAHDNTRDVVTKEGVRLEFNCAGCNWPLALTIEYTEMIALKYGLDPVAAFQQQPQLIQHEAVKWSFDDDERAWKPQLKCSNCPFHYALRLEPHEPEKFLAQARHAGYVDPEGEARVSQWCVQVREAKLASRR